MEIITRRRAHKRLKRMASICRAIKRSLRHVENVGVLGVDKNPAEIVVAKDAWIFSRPGPGSARIVRPIEPLRHYGIQPLSAGMWCNRHTQPIAAVLGQTL